MWRYRGPQMQAPRIAAALQLAYKKKVSTEAKSKRGKRGEKVEKPTLDPAIHLVPAASEVSNLTCIILSFISLS